MKNYFKILELKESIHIKKNDLEEKYKKLCILNHPDNFEEEKDIFIANEKLSQLNFAYNIIKDKAFRIEHFLQLKGFEIKKDQNLKDKIFLEKIIEYSEKIHFGENVKKIISSEIDSLFYEIENKINERNYAESLELLMKIKYLKKLI